ncbi:MAG: hypothetical protein KBF98_11875 [Rhodoferax sp.]|nr:hypothetical protein [Rhodoferax sp.]
MKIEDIDFLLSQMRDASGLDEFVGVGSYSISKSFVTRREAADSASARQGDATKSWMIWKWN